MLKIVSLLLAVYLFICAFLYLMQRSMLYFPTAPNPADLADSLWISSAQQRIKVWRINQGPDAVIYFGGNAEAVENNLSLFDEILGGRSVYLVNYPGYGGSEGKPSQQALFAAALHVYDEISAKHRRISVIGRSLGSGVACYLAAQREIERLVLITPYDSMVSLASTHYPVFPVRWLLKDRFESTRYAAAIDIPTLVLIAETDRVVPRKHALRLVESFERVEPQVAIIENADHNSIGAFSDYQRRLGRFVVGDG